MVALDIDNAVGQGGTFLQVSAIHGFPNALVPDLQRMCLEEKIVIHKSKLPKTEKGLVQLLLKNFLGAGITRERMNEIWQLRGSVQRDIRRAETSELLSANLDCVEGVLGEDDIDAIVDVVKASREKYKKILASGVKKSMVGVKSLPRDNDIDLADAKMLAPPRGILSKDTVRHWRWHFKLDLSAKG